MTFTEIPLGELVTIAKDTWKPTAEPGSQVRHYSIPAFDKGSYETVQASEIASNKFNISEPSILYSKLNPIKPRIWRVEPVDEIRSVTSTEFLVLVPNMQKDAHYIEAVLTSSQFTAKAAALVNGTSGSHQRIHPSDLLSISVPWPDIDEYRVVIGQQFWMLNEKIRINQQIASTLEQIAQAIFKSWFVDFDPVHAKARGEDPVGMDAETAALFPDSFEDSALGLIPAGWKCLALGDLVQPKKGKTITKSTTRDGHVPVVAGGLEPAYFHDTSNVNPPVVTISASGANAGFVRLYTQPIWASDCTYISRDQSDLVLFWLQFLKLNQTRIYDMQQGGAQPHIYASDLMRLEVCVPEETSLLASFEALIQPMFDAIGSNARANETLEKLRDSILPRLISGELEIPDELLES